MVPGEPDTGAQILPACAPRLSRLERARLAVAPGAGRLPMRPRSLLSAAELASEPGRLAPADDPDAYFEFATEAATARAFWERGLDVRSVRLLRGSAMATTPDAVVSRRGGSRAAEVTAEFKTVTEPTRNAVKSAVRRARRQSRRVVVDVRGVELPRREAVEALRAAAVDYGGELDEILVLGRRRGGEFVLRWP